MPKNTKGGSGHKRGKNKVPQQNRNLVLRRPPLQDYAIVTKVLGDCRFMLSTSSDRVLIGHLRGKLMKRSWIGQWDLVLFAYREVSNDQTVDIILKYPEDQAKMVRRMENLVFSADSRNSENNGQRVIFEEADDNRETKKRLVPDSDDDDEEEEEQEGEEEGEEEEEEDEEKEGGNAGAKAKEGKTDRREGQKYKSKPKSKEHLPNSEKAACNILRSNDCVNLDDL